MEKMKFKHLKGKSEDEVSTIGALAKKYHAGIELPLIFQYLLRVNVLPVGTCIEIYGPKGSSKSSLALEWCQKFVDSSGYAIYLDSENKLPADIGKFFLGGKREKYVTYRRMKNMTETANTSEDLIKQIEKNEEKLKKAGKRIPHGIMVIDSLICGLGTSEEKRVNKSGIDSQGAFAPYASVWTDFFRYVNTALHNLNCTLMVINQFRQNVGQFTGGGGHSPGGEAKEHALSFAIEIQPKGRTQKENIVEAYKEFKVRITKNTSGPSDDGFGQNQNTSTSEAMRLCWNNVTRTFWYDYSRPLCSIITKFLSPGTGIEGFGPLKDLTKYGGVFTSKSMDFEKLESREVEAIIENTPEIKNSFQEQLGIAKRPIIGKPRVYEEDEKKEEEKEQGTDEESQEFQCEFCDKKPYKREGDLINHIQKEHSEQTDN